MVKVNIKEIIRKHQLLRKEDLNQEEQKELNSINLMISNIQKELISLDKQGAELINENNKEVKMEKMSPADRREKAEEIIKKGFEGKVDRKIIINRIIEELSVSNTYASKVLKGMEGK